MDFHYSPPPTTISLFDMFDVLVTHEKVKKLHFHANIVFMNEQEQPRVRERGKKISLYKNLHFYELMPFVWRVLKRFLLISLHHIQIHWILVEKIEAGGRRRDETIELVWLNEIFLGERKWKCFSFPHSLLYFFI